MSRHASGSTRRADALPLAFEAEVGLLLRDCRHDVSSFDVGSSWDRDAFRDGHRFDCGDTLLASIFDHPFEGGDCLCHRLLHQLTLGDDIRTAPRNPGCPDKLLWLSADVLVFRCLRADGFAVFAIRCAWPRNTNLLALHAPACGCDLLVFTYQPTNLAATVGTATAMSATSICRVAEHWCKCGGNHGPQKQST